LDRELESAGKSAAFLTALSAVSQMLAFGYRVGLSRLVGAEVMGLYQLVMPVYSVLMSLTAVGLTCAMSNLSSQYLALDNTRGVEQTLGKCLRLFFIAAIPLGLAVTALYDPISVYLLGDARTQLGLVLLIPCVLLTGVENLHKHFFYGTGQVRPPALTELAEQFIRTGAVLGLLVWLLPQYPERVVGIIVTGMILCEIFSAVTQTILYRRRIRQLGIHGAGEDPRVLTRRVLRIALPVGGTALLGNLMNAVNSALIPQRLVAAGMDRSQAMSAFGVLCGMTMPMLSLPTLFLGALNLVMVPRLARSCALGHRERVQGRIRRALRLTALIILPCMALMVVIGPALGRLVYHEESAGDFILPLAAAMVCSCFQSVLSGALSGIGRQGTSALIATGCDVVQLAFTVFAMGRPGMGMEGYVAGLVVSSALGAGLCGLAVCRYTGVNLELGRSLGLPGLAAVLSGQTGMLLFRRLEGTGQAVQLGVTVLFGAGIYLAALYAMGAGPERKR